MTSEQKQLADAGEAIPLLRSLTEAGKITLEKRAALTLWCFNNLPATADGKTPRDLVAEFPRALEVLNMLNGVAIGLLSVDEVPDMTKGLGGPCFDRHNTLAERHALAAVFAVAGGPIIKASNGTIAVYWLLQSCEDKAKAARALCAELVTIFSPKRSVTMAELF